MRFEVSKNKSEYDAFKSGEYVVLGNRVTALEKRIAQLAAKIENNTNINVGAGNVDMSALE